MGEATDEVRSTNEFNDPTLQRSSGTRATTTNESADEAGQEAAQIRSGIEQTRADLSETIDALQEKLDPTRIAEQVKDQIRDKAGEAYETAKDAVKEATIGKAEKIMSNVSNTVTNATERAGTAVRDTSSSVVEYIRENPVSFALIGIGAGMLAFSTRRKEQSTYDRGRNVDADLYGRSGAGDWRTAQSSFADRARDAGSGVADRAREAGENLRDAATTAADTARQQLDYVSDQARQGARVASDRFKTTLEDNPMALGVAALAAGALLGLSLPKTRVENEYMGETRDRLVDQAKSVTSEAVEKVQRVTGEAGRTLKDAAQKEGLMVGQPERSQSS
ncbi:MAG: DUF3618 domain-containing protein [Bryobacteraceae bacterium]|jgi:ElaB/YqjD/DUF883 family membrane-anchored ribosome-binding protein